MNEYSVPSSPYEPSKEVGYSVVSFDKGAGSNYLVLGCPKPRILYVSGAWEV